MLIRRMLTGRTTFVNTLCGKTVLPHKDSDDPNSANIEEGVKIKPVTVGMAPAHAMLAMWRATDQSLRARARRGRHKDFPDRCRYSGLRRSSRQRGMVSDLRRTARVITGSLTCCCSFAEIVGYLERLYDDILAEESRIKRNPRFRDNRVHALLYFITPTGHGCV